MNKFDLMFVVNKLANDLGITPHTAKNAVEKALADAQKILKLYYFF